jgi:hypothetical protein
MYTASLSSSDISLNRQQMRLRIRRYIPATTFERDCHQRSCCSVPVLCLRQKVRIQVSKGRSLMRQLIPATKLTCSSHQPPMPSSSSTPLTTSDLTSSPVPVKACSPS